jgi:O-antigen ligase
LLVMERYRAGALSRFWGGVLLASLPLAILATKTRAVWLSFLISMSCLLFCSAKSAGKRTRKWLVVAALGVGLSLLAAGDSGTIGERFSESSAVEFRMAAYRAGWSMFLERPIAGWGINQLQSEVSRRLDGFQGEEFVAVHNTYFEILIEHGVLGFALYGWLIWRLAGLRRLPMSSETRPNFADAVQRVWPLLLGVYLVNATFVVMNYQFVNGLVFTFAGILAARQRNKETPSTVGAAQS